jgi:rRNA-processing protein FCF1
VILIAPGYAAETVLAHIQVALAEAETLQGSFPGGFDGYTSYLAWATRHQRTLGAAVSQDDIDRLVTTRRYWALLGISISSEPLMTLIQLEIAERVVALQAEYRELRRALDRWKNKQVVMAILDTNVLMHSHARLEEINWGELLDERPNVPILLWIPIAVVGELDRLKKAQGNMSGEKDSPPRRTVAKAALRTLNRLFRNPDEVVRLADHASVESGNQVDVGLLMEERRHVRLAAVDAELMDVTSSVTPLAIRAYLVTFDSNLAFSALHNGLQVKLLNENDFPV